VENSFGNQHPESKGYHVGIIAARGQLALVVDVIIAEKQLRMAE
jgi:hypothetical protein